MAHIVFLMSDTGGGHRAACQAIESALRARQPDRFTFEQVDVWKQYTPFPLNTVPGSAARWIDINPAGFSAIFRIWDHLFRTRWCNRLYCRQMFSRMRQLFREHPADAVICVHAAFVRPAIYALRKLKIDKPFITVITDYAWPQVLWYDRAVDLCLAPTEAARQRGLLLGMNPSQIVLTGPPIHPKFCRIDLSPGEARERLGWKGNERTILMIAGGDGTGPLVSTARALDERLSSCQLAIVTGRNAAVKSKLESIKWKHSVHIYGFVDNIELMMRASDVLITKAGPATITEAAVLGLPMVMNTAIRYQESPNVEFIVKHRAGVYAPGPKKTAECIGHLLETEGALEALSRAARTIAEPDAIWKIADQITSIVAGPDRLENSKFVVAQR